MKLSHITLTTTIILSIITSSITTIAGPIQGTVKFSGYLNPATTDKYTVVLNADETTHVIVESLDNKDIDCSVYDENANLVDEDKDPTPNCLLTIIPKWTGKFYIIIKNASTSSTSYSGLIK